jgi:hypothetical protein
MNVTKFSPYRKENTALLLSKISWLMLSKEKIAVYTENHTKPINTLCGQNSEIEC